MKLQTVAIATLLAANAAQAEVTVENIMVAPINLGVVTFKSGTEMSFDVGIGSGATHWAGQDADAFYTLADRGPNIKCKSAEKVTGLGFDVMCAGEKGSKIFPMPDFTPVILEYRWETNGIELLREIPLTGQSGKPISGITNPLTVTNTESAFGADGVQIPFDPSGLDTEGLAVAPDGSFWIGEEYGASILHVSADGKILARFVPEGMETDLAGADYPVYGALPAIIAKRKLNRGIEGVALSPDGSALYFAMQSPLANPDVAAYKNGAFLRIFKFDIAGQSVTGEWLYPMDDPTGFVSDNAATARTNKDVKVSELAMLPDGQLLVLERISKTTRLYRVDPDGPPTVPGRFDDPATTPTLEQLGAGELATAEVTPLVKTLVLDSDTLAGKPVKKLEGIAIMGPNQLIMVNDNDFGLGDATHMLRLTFPQDIEQTEN